MGKGIRTAPRDALVADSVDKKKRGLAFGLHKALDSAGATLGLLGAAALVWFTQADAVALSRDTFQTIVLISIIPAILSVLALALIAQDVKVSSAAKVKKLSLAGLGKPFITYLAIVGLFTLGNSSDGFLVLRAQTLGVSVMGIFLMLAVFKLVYSIVATPAGSLSDRIGRRQLIIYGWLIYALIYFGFAFATQAWQAWVLYIAYGLYYGLAYGVINALVADLVPSHLRGTAYGVYNATVGLLAFPASLIAGLLWQGIGTWSGFGPQAPFIFGGALALIAAALMKWLMPSVKRD